MTAVLVGHDIDSDIAVLQIRPEEMPNRGLIAPADWGDSDTLEVGSLVWAMGAPYGLEGSVTSGIVSARHRGDKVGNPLQDFLQTDVAVNPGNSGGPLVDDQGRVVGINTAIVGENYRGISFAVPSRVARKVYEEIVSDPSRGVRRGYLGVLPDPMTDERAKAAGLDETRGAYVLNVMADSPAARLKLKRGDIILAWNGIAIESPAHLTSVICDTESGSDATVTIWRDGKSEELRLKVGVRPQNPSEQFLSPPGK
jgi:serine protease Do